MLDNLDTQSFKITGTSQDEKDLADLLLRPYL